MRMLWFRVAQDALLRGGVSVTCKLNGLEGHPASIERISSSLAWWSRRKWIAAPSWQETDELNTGGNENIANVQHLFQRLNAGGMRLEPGAGIFNAKGALAGVEAPVGLARK